jgi:hypothetical protein
VFLKIPELNQPTKPMGGGMGPALQRDDGNDGATNIDPILVLVGTRSDAARFTSISV